MSVSGGICGQVTRRLARAPRQHVVGEQCPEQMTRAHAVCALLDGGQQPALLDHIDDIGRERRGARVAGLHPLERAVEVGQQAGRFDIPFAQDRGEVGIGTIEQADQQMFDLDVVVGSQSRNAGRCLEATTADIVQASYQWLEFYRAHVFLVSSWDIIPGGPAAHRLSCNVRPVDKRIFERRWRSVCFVTLRTHAIGERNRREAAGETFIGICT